jgi:peptidoglycan/LPS O-acetylase OafA/YrhL
MPDPHLRAADTDREAVAAILGRALSDGRLAVDEYEERLGKAYAARTYGDLEPLTSDLPRQGSPSRPAPELVRGSLGTGRGPAARPHQAGMCGSAQWGRGPMRTMWGPWITTVLIVTAIWLATSLASGGPSYFWPIWVIVPWGAVLLASCLTGPRRPSARNRRPR